MSIPWKLLVIAPLVVGVVILLMTIIAWKIPRIDNFLQNHGIFLEYLCLGGLLLMCLSSYLMILAGYSSRKTDKIH